MNPIQYLTPTGLRGLIRNPKTVRTWPQQQMPGFDETMLREADLVELIAYFGYRARHLSLAGAFHDQTASSATRMKLLRISLAGFFAVLIATSVEAADYFPPRASWGRRP